MLIITLYSLLSPSPGLAGSSGNIPSVEECAAAAAHVQHSQPADPRGTGHKLSQREAEVSDKTENCNRIPPADLTNNGVAPDVASLVGPPISLNCFVSKLEKLIANSSVMPNSQDSQGC